MSFEEFFKGKKVLITGAGRGLGRALTGRLYKYGAHVYALAKNPDNLESLRNEFPSIETICVDLSNWSYTRSALVNLDVMDCLVNNAAHVVVTGAMTASEEDFDNIFNVNVKAVMNVTQIIGQKMIDAGRPGSILNVSSLAGSRQFPLVNLYGSSKSAMVMMSKCLAVDLAPHNIRVNILEPGCFDTDMVATVAEGIGKALGAEPEDRRETFFSIIKARTPTGNPLMPLDQVVNTVLFALSDLATQMTGQILNIDGGFSCT